MAYPLIQGPTVAEFTKTATKTYGCALKTVPGKLTGPQGSFSISYLERGKKFSEPLPADQTARLTPDTLRRLCKQLGIALKEFGLTLG